MQGKDYYCNCDSPCINKGGLRKCKTWKDGKWTKNKVQVCNNHKSDCTCKYRTDLGSVFKY